MDARYWIAPLAFVIDAALSFYAVVVLMRFLGQWVAADFRNPLFQFAIRITHPLIRPLRRIIPPAGRIDTAALVLMFLVEALDVGVLTYLDSGALPDAARLALVALARGVELALDVGMFLVLGEALLSWVNTGYPHPAAQFVHALTRPILRPIQRILPSVGGLDLSPLLALLAFQVIKMLAAPLTAGL